jgi:hypothetical protein
MRLLRFLTFCYEIIVSPFSNLTLSSSLAFDIRSVSLSIRYIFQKQKQEIIAAMSSSTTAGATTAAAVTFSTDTKPAAVERTSITIPEEPGFDFDAVDFDAAKFVTHLMGEQPSIDAALKSYASWIAATQPAVTALHASAVAAASTTSAINHDNMNDDVDDEYAFIPTTWSLPEILSMTRHLSREINQHTFAVQRVETRQYSETAKVWNNVVGQNGVKPTRVLGRSALQQAWPDLDLTWSTSDNDKTRCNGNADTIADANDVLLRQKTSLFVRRFGELLLSERKHVDARLIWDTDKGQKELQRRATERNQRAAANAKQQEAAQLAALQQVVVEAGGANQEASHSMDIQELPDDDEQES